MPEMQQRGAGIFSSTAHDDADDDKDPHAPSSIPPWVHANKTDDDEQENLLAPPRLIRPNTRHYKPPPPHNYKPGRKWDHLRNAEPPFLSTPIADAQTRWTPFMASSPNPENRAARHEGRIVDAAWMAENMPDMHPDWRPEDEDQAESSGRKGVKGLMLMGKWLISPERQERTARIFWVSDSAAFVQCKGSDCGLVLGSLQAMAPSAKGIHSTSERARFRTVLIPPAETPLEEPLRAAFLPRHGPYVLCRRSGHRSKHIRCCTESQPRQRAK